MFDLTSLHLSSLKKGCTQSPIFTVMDDLGSSRRRYPSTRVHACTCAKKNECWGVCMCVGPTRWTICSAKWNASLLKDITLSPSDYQHLVITNSQWFRSALNYRRLGITAKDRGPRTEFLDLRWFWSDNDKFLTSTPPSSAVHMILGY